MTESVSCVCRPTVERKGFAVRHFDVKILLSVAFSSHVLVLLVLFEIRFFQVDENNPCARVVVNQAAAAVEVCVSDSITEALVAHVLARTLWRYDSRVSSFIAYLMEDNITVLNCVAHCAYLLVRVFDYQILLFFCCEYHKPYCLLILYKNRAKILFFLKKMSSNPR